MDRTERQKQSLEKWRQSKGKGTIQACTGFGKTRVATNASKKMWLNNANTQIIVVVPTIPLKNQWEKTMTELKLINNTKIYVINTLILSPEVLSCDLLILDEIHKYAADTFYSVFDLVAYKFILGLTATLERLDEKHKLLEEHCPIVDDIPLSEARKNGWVADFLEYNLEVEMEEQEAKKYKEIETWLNKAFAIFHHDYYLMLDCCSPKDRFFKNKMHYGAETFVRTHVKKFGEPLILYDGLNNRLVGWQLVNEVVKQANNCRRLIQEREKFLTNSDTKKQVAFDIIKTLKMKTVTFGKSTECADELTKMINEDAEKEIAASYHSYLESEERQILKFKEYKTKKGVLKFFEENECVKWEQVEDKLFRVYYYKIEKYGKTRLKKEVIEKLENDRLSVINSAKALDLGLDVTGMQLAIIISGDSNPTTQTQRIGRVIRKEGEKVAIIINIILKDTQDVKWCRRRQSKNARFVRHIQSIEDIMI